MQCPPTATPGRWMWLNGCEFGGGDDVVDVDADRVGGARELVGERDVHVAVGRLGELRQLGRLGAAHRPHLGVEERRVELGARAARPRALRPPTSFGYVARSRKTRPLNTRSGLNAVKKSSSARQAAAPPRAAARSASRVVPDRAPSSRSTTVVPRLQPARRSRRSTASSAPQSGLRVRVDVERRHGDDEVRALGDRGGRVGRRAQAPVADDLAQHVVEVAPRRGTAARRALTSSTTRSSMSQPTTSWPARAICAASGSPTLPSATTTAFMRAASLTVSPLRALSSTASAVTHGLQPRLERDDRRVVVAGDVGAERLVLDEQRLAAVEREARRVALGHAAQLLRGGPLDRPVGVLVQRQVAGRACRRRASRARRGSACGATSSA